MSEPSLGDGDCWSPLVAAQVDEACDRFEAAWKAAVTAGEQPRIESYLASVPGPARILLLSELIFLDIHYRRLHGEGPQPADYVGRFPDLHADWVVHEVASRATVRKGPAAGAG